MHTARRCGVGAVPRSPATASLRGHPALHAGFPRGDSAAFWGLFELLQRPPDPLLACLSSRIHSAWPRALRAKQAPESEASAEKLLCCSYGSRQRRGTRRASNHGRPRGPPTGAPRCVGCRRSRAQFRVMQLRDAVALCPPGGGVGKGAAATPAGPPFPSAGEPPSLLCSYAPHAALAESSALAPSNPAIRGGVCSLAAPLQATPDGLQHFGPFTPQPPATPPKQSLAVGRLCAATRGASPAAAYLGASREPFPSEQPELHEDASSRRALDSVASTDFVRARFQPTGLFGIVLFVRASVLLQAWCTQWYEGPKRVFKSFSCRVYGRLAEPLCRWFLAVVRRHGRRPSSMEVETQCVRLRSLALTREDEGIGGEDDASGGGRCMHSERSDAPTGVQRQAEHQRPRAFASGWRDSFAGGPSAGYALWQAPQHVGSSTSLALGPSESVGSSFMSATPPPASAESAVLPCISEKRLVERPQGGVTEQPGGAVGSLAASQVSVHRPLGDANGLGSEKEAETEGSSPPDAAGAPSASAVSRTASSSACKEPSSGVGIQQRGGGEAGADAFYVNHVSPPPAASLHLRLTHEQTAMAATLPHPQLSVPWNRATGHFECTTANVSPPRLPMGFASHQLPQHTAHRVPPLIVGKALP
ncbi:hypothetical protein cyc_00240 [Cyclospora cayetanensis]|uniref:Uncharacterized protein n=1 Tax=Cyclospora cayetanensis TaxID=88456 RepID=A0A1D3D4P1_9EIME|nr:hypothetical protein cyc_00240 [Cyclospora cayetanensis]